MGVSDAITLAGNKDRADVSWSRKTRTHAIHLNSLLEGMAGE